MLPGQGDIELQIEMQIEVQIEHNDQIRLPSSPYDHASPNRNPTQTPLRPRREEHDL